MVPRWLPPHKRPAALAPSRREAWVALLYVIETLLPLAISLRLVAVPRSVVDTCSVVPFEIVADAILRPCYSQVRMGGSRPAGWAGPGVPCCFSLLLQLPITVQLSCLT